MTATGSSSCRYDLPTTSPSQMAQNLKKSISQNKPSLQTRQYMLKYYSSLSNRIWSEPGSALKSPTDPFLSTVEHTMYASVYI